MTPARHIWFPEADVVSAGFLSGLGLSFIHPVRFPAALPPGLARLLPVRRSFAIGRCGLPPRFGGCPEAFRVFPKSFGHFADAVGENPTAGRAFPPAGRENSSSVRSFAEAFDHFPESFRESAEGFGVCPEPLRETIF